MRADVMYARILSVAIVATLASCSPASENLSDDSTVSAPPDGMVGAPSDVATPNASFDLARLPPDVAELVTSARGAQIAGRRIADDACAVAARAVEAAQRAANGESGYISDGRYQGQALRFGALGMLDQSSPGGDQMFIGRLDSFTNIGPDPNRPWPGSIVGSGQLNVGPEGAALYSFCGEIDDDFARAGSYGRFTWAGGGIFEGQLWSADSFGGYLPHPMPHYGVGVLADGRVFEGEFRAAFVNPGSDNENQSFRLIQGVVWSPDGTSFELVSN